MMTLRKKRTRQQERALFAKFGKMFKKGLKRQRVKSSNIHSIGYEPKNEILEIKFKSKSVYRYAHVPQKVYKRFLNAGSKGKFLAKKIKGEYPYNRVS